MAEVFQKLNLKNQIEILVLNAQKSFESELATLSDVAVKRSLADVQQIDFAQVFVTSKKEVDKIFQQLADKARWDVIETTGYQPVRIVAIDEDWSDLRYRRLVYVKR